MGKLPRRLGKLFSMVLVVLFAFSAILAVPSVVEAADYSKNEKSYDIAVVFDNSGSMYESAAWCRAKYAMEIFASMLNYGKDKLHIFPMWNVVTDGSKPSSGGSYEPIEIKSEKDINQISNMYSIGVDRGTPFEPIAEAYNYLKSSGADEKWLIVLTDGTFNRIERNGDQIPSLKGDPLRQRLLELSSNNIKLQYVGFGDALPLDADKESGFFTKKSTDTSLKDDLIEICNYIFQRSVLPANRLSGNSLNIDLSMKNLIVFAQGKDATINSLKDSNGKEIAVTLNSGRRKYSEIGALGYNNPTIDNTLAGQVVTFAACPKGQYTLSYSGADKIQVFYEPDVDISVKITNDVGDEIKSEEDFVVGDYTITSSIVDRVTGEDVTNHELMGNDVKLKTYVKTSKDSDYKEYPNGARISFANDSKTEIYIEGEYLGKYKITSKDDPKLSWLSNINVNEPDLKLRLSAEQTWYKLRDHDNWKPIRVDLTKEGKPLTDEELERTTIKVNASNGLKYRFEALPGESAFNIYVSQKENGEYVEPETGGYELGVLAVHTKKSGEEIKSNSDSVEFEIQRYSKIWRYLFWILIFLILFTIWLLFMLQKVLPKSIVKDSANFTTMSSGELDSTFVNVEYRRKGKSLTVAGSTAVDFNEQCSASFDLRAVDNRFTPSKKRRIAIIGIDSQCEELKISGIKYAVYEGRWVKATDLKKAETGKVVPPLDQVVSCSTRYELSRSGGLSTLTCKTKTIK